MFNFRPLLLLILCTVFRWKLHLTKHFVEFTSFSFWDVVAQTFVENSKLLAIFVLILLVSSGHLFILLDQNTTLYLHNQFLYSFSMVRNDSFSTSVRPPFPFWYFVHWAPLVALISKTVFSAFWPALFRATRFPLGARKMFTTDKWIIFVLHATFFHMFMSALQEAIFSIFGRSFCWLFTFFRSKLQLTEHVVESMSLPIADFIAYAFVENSFLWDSFFEVRLVPVGNSFNCFRWK